MKLMLKFMTVIIGILLAILIASFVLVKMFISPERVKHAVLPLAEKALHRKVMLDDVQISIFSGIELSGLKIMNAAGDKPFAVCTRAQLHYEFIPLLQGKVVINEVGIQGPELNITRNRDGSFNFSDILADSKSGTSEGAQAAQPPPVPEASRPAKNKNQKKNKLAILVSNISIADGKIIFTDMAAPGNRAVRIAVTETNLKIQDFSPASPFPVKFSAKLNGGEIASQGSIQLLGPSADMDISVKGLDLTGLRPYFATSLPGTLNKAALTSSIKVKFKPEILDTSGSIRLADISFVPAAKPDADISGVSLGLVFAISLDRSSDILTVRSTDLDLNGMKVKTAGKITGLSNTPSVDIKVELPSQNLSALIAAIPAAYAGQAKAFSPSGAISAAASLQGNPEKGTKILKSASIDLDQVKATINGIPAGLDGGLILEGDRIKSKDLVIKAKDSSIATSIEARNIFGKPIILKTAMNSKDIDLDAILGASRQENGAMTPEPQDTATNAAPGKQEVKTAGSAATEPEPVHIPLDADGTVMISQLRYQGAQVRDIDIHYSLKNNKLHIVQKAKMADGTITKDINIDLGVKGYSYNGDFNIEHVKTSEIMAFAAPSFSDILNGDLGMKGSFRGSGIVPQDIKKNIWLQGTWKIADAKLGKGKVISGLAAFLKLDRELDNTEFSNADGNFNIEAGEVIFTGKFRSDRIRFAPQGKISLEGDLDIRLNAVLSPELAAKLPTGKFMSLMQDKNGWTILPVIITGTCTRPGFGLDTAVVGKQLQEKALHQLTDQLFKKKGRDTKQDSGGTASQDSKKEQDKKTGSDMLGHAIKGLFEN